MVKIGMQWLNGLARAGKAQRRTVNKLVKNLFAVPKVKAKSKPKAKPAVKPKAAPRTRILAQASASAPRPKPAARQAPLPGKWLASHYSSLSGTLPGRRMSYWLYLPDKAPSAAVLSRGLPLIVMLHGCDQTATQFAQGTRMNRLAEQKGYAVLYPQQSIGAHPHRCWKWYEKATQEGGGDVGMIVGIIDQVAAKYAIDRSRIYIGGMSAGAAMADIVAINHPELIAAVGMHSGPVFGAAHGTIGALGVMQHGSSQRAGMAISEILAKNPAFPPMPAILIQGADDKVIRPINQNQLEQQSVLLNRLSGDTDITRQVEAARPAGSRNPAHGYEMRDFYVGKKLMLKVAHIEQLGHAWSGGDASLSFNSKAGPDASKMMLEFFSRHQRELR